MERGGTLQSNSLKAIIVLALVVIIWAILGLSQHDIGTVTLNQTNHTVLSTNFTVEITEPITTGANHNITEINITTNSTNFEVYNVSINDGNYTCNQSGAYVVCTNVSDVLTQNNTFLITVNVTADADGVYEFNINTSDNNTEYNTTISPAFTVDSTLPTWDLTDLTPVNSNISGTFNITAFELTDVNQNNNSVYFRLVNSTGNNLTAYTQMENTTDPTGGSVANYSYLGSQATSGLTDGLYYIVFNATDLYGNENSSTDLNRSITVDNSVPTWDLTDLTPVAGANVSGLLEVTLFEVFDLTLDNDSAYFRLVNSTGSNVTSWIQMVNSSFSSGGADGLDVGNFSGNVSTVGLVDGLHYVVFNVTDGAGNENSTAASNITITVDNTVPVWVLPVSPLNLSNVSGLLQVVDLVVSDLTLDNDSAYFRLVNSTGSNVTSWIQMVNSSFSSGGADNENSTAASNITITVDNTVPVWVLPVSPLNLSNVSGLLQVVDLVVSDLTLDNDSAYFRLVNSTGSNVTSWIQ